MKFLNVLKNLFSTVANNAEAITAFIKLVSATVDSAQQLSASFSKKKAQ